MDICDEENDVQDDTKKKLKVFEYYCGKINNGFEKLSHKITDYVANLWEDVDSWINIYLFRFSRYKYWKY